jgi:hypothetical protein
MNTGKGTSGSYDISLDVLVSFISRALDCFVYSANAQQGVCLYLSAIKYLYSSLKHICYCIFLTLSMLAAVLGYFNIITVSVVGAGIAQSV